ncbi:hypothetical protein AAFF_G00126980 [Aldrovandia affinis]|uniref:Uncharacterized protein n=1 Tax=Aldrovandia affinis TaxID=143900 RepID=A0AAD7WX20_9TELE|nr:hypothetical protein AAFF_G00126980 [Aldrovandia affinis]
MARAAMATCVSVGREESFSSRPVLTGKRRTEKSFQKGNHCGDALAIGARHNHFGPFLRRCTVPHDMPALTEPR